MKGDPNKSFVKKNQSQLHAFSCGSASMGNITRMDSELLADDLISYPYEYGFFICVPEQGTVELLYDRGYSEAFVDLINIAIEQGYSYLRLDRDEEPIEGLELFDW